MIFRGLCFPQIYQGADVELRMRGADGFGITVLYWSSEEAIAAWKAHLDHKPAQEAGKRVWDADYQLRIARVERDYGKTH